MQKQKAFVPTAFEMFAYSFISLVVLVAINGPHFIRRLSSGKDYQDSAQFISEFIRTHITFLDTERYGTLSVLGFWMIVGLISYLGITLFTRLASYYGEDDTRNKHMVFPSAAARRKQHILYDERTLIRTVAMVFFFMWLFVFLRYLLPQTVSSFATGTESFKLAWEALLAFLGLAACLYTFTVLLRCIVLRVRVFIS